MYNLLLNKRLNDYDSRVKTKLRDIYKENLETYPNYLLDQGVSVFTIILWQLISKITGSLQVYSYSIDSTENTDNIVNNFSENSIIFVGTAPSTFSRTIKTFRKKYGAINTQVDDLTQNLTASKILGTTKNLEKKHFYIFTNTKTSAGSNQYIIFATLLMLPILETIEGFEKEKETLRKLKEYFCNTKEPFSYDNEQGIKDIILDYIKDNENYTVSVEKELKSLIKTKKEAKLKSYLYNVETCREKLKEALAEVASITKSFNDANEIYTALVNNMKQDDIDTEIDDMIDFLRRSKLIKGFGVLAPSVYYTICQPLKINSKEDWQRIERNLQMNNDLRELLHKTFIDEEYNLCSEASVAIDLLNSSIGRFGEPDTVTQSYTIPNPHINHYNCFGTHTNIIANLIAKNATLEAIEQSIEAEAYLNWSDSAVINVLIRYFETNTYKTKQVFENTKTGELISLEDYVNAKSSESTDSNDRSEC